MLRGVVWWLSVSAELLFGCVGALNPALLQEWLSPHSSGLGGLALIELIAWGSLGRLSLAISLKRSPHLALLWLMSLPQQLWALLSLHHLGHFGALWHATQLLLCAGWLWCALSVSGRTRAEHG